MFLKNMFNQTKGVSDMKNLKYFFVGIFVVSLFSMQSCTQMTQDVEKVKKQIEEKQVSFMENFNGGNAKASTEHYAVDAIVAPPHSSEVKGKEAIEKLWQSYIDMGKASVKLNTVNTDVSGNIAVVYQKFQFEATMPDGQVIKDNGKSIVVYEKQEDGNWLIKYDTWNSDLPLPSIN